MSGREAPPWSGVTVAVPASSANLGPGYDCLGLALEMRNSVHVRSAPDWAVKFSGEGVGEADQPLDRSNLLVRAYEAGWRAVHPDREPPVACFEVEAEIPVSRGLGASGVAVVAGVLAAMHRAGGPEDRDLALRVAASVEGHPDNVAASLLGGLCISLARSPGNPDQGHLCHRLPLSPEVAVTLVVPAVRLETEAARAVVPQQVSTALAVRSAGRVGLLVSELAAAVPDGDRLAVALSDEIHEPARESLVPPLAELRAVARRLGAWGGVLSGAGPSVLLLHSQSVVLDPEPLLEPWRQRGVAARVLPLQPAVEGARCSALGGTGSAQVL